MINDLLFYEPKNTIGIIIRIKKAFKKRTALVEFNDGDRIVIVLSDYKWNAEKKVWLKT